MSDNIQVTKPFSDTLKALLLFSKKSDREFTVQAVIKECLGELYHYEMKTKDVLLVVTNTIKELYSIKEFQAGREDTLVFDILKAPFDGGMRLGDPVFGPGKNDKFTLEEVYNSILAEMLYKFTFANVGWCRDYLFSEEKKGE